MEKKCSKCQITKSIEEFNNKKNRKQSECRNCVKSYLKVYRENNKEKIKKHKKS